MTIHFFDLKYNCTHSKESTPPANICRWLRVVMEVVRWRLAWSNCLMSLVISLTCAGRGTRESVWSKDKREGNRHRTEKGRCETRWTNYWWGNGTKTNRARMTHPLVWEIIAPICLSGEGLVVNLLYSPIPLSFLWLSLTYTDTKHSASCSRQTHGRCISLTLTKSPHCPPFKKGGYRFAIMTDKCEFFKVKQKICAWPQIQLRGKLVFLLQLKFGHTIVPLCSVYRQK